jgi:type II protein arginine methyltransferase
MSLDGGGISNAPGAQDTASAVEEDYCLHGRERFHHEWASTGVFHAGALRLYGITGEPGLLRSIRQTRMLAATFGTCFLGRFPPTCAPPANGETPSAGVSNDAAAVLTNTQPASREDLPFDTLLLGPVRPSQLSSDPQKEADAWRREVMNAWDVLQTPSEWCQTMNGVVTEMNWSSREQRQRIKEQLELASFMCLRAVQVPLPFYSRELPWAAGVDDVDDDVGDGGVEVKAPAVKLDEGYATAMTPEEDEQRNTRLACLAADILLAFIQQASGVKVWVRCDGCSPSHRYQMQRLRQAVLYGYTRYTARGSRGSSGLRFVYQINTPCSVTGSQNACFSHGGGSTAGVMNNINTSTQHRTVHTEAVSALMTMLYFSAWHPRMLLPSEWFGEQVVCFECPPAPLLFACMAPHGIPPQQHPHYRLGAAMEGGERNNNTSAAMAAAADTSGVINSVLTGEEERERALEEDEGVTPLSQLSLHDDPHHLRPPQPPVHYTTSRQSSPARLPDMEEKENDTSAMLSATNYSLGDWGNDIATDGQHTPAAGGAGGGDGAGSNMPNSAGASAMSTPFPTDQADAADTQRSYVLRHRYTYVMPDDLHPLGTARWAGSYPPFVSVLTFLVEMMRRRAYPLFDRGFFDQYPLLNYLYFKAVEEPTRDVFASYEGQLQLPLQPLGHQLSSGVYEVFERDARKYRQYREAVYSYVKDWYEAGQARQHALQNKGFFERHGVMREVPVPSADERVLYLVLLGCGRGPLIDECLNAVSALGVRLRLFAIEKNRPAAAFTRMRWANDPEWAQLAYTFGHTLEVIVADGRHIARAAEEGTVTLPPDFGLCDVVVSELLGSFGDNELSPECLEGFHAQLQAIQQSRGLHHNAHLTCIPQRYTAWVAPLMSASLEAAVAEAAVKGLTVAPPQCPDVHAALDHSLLVTNLSRGVTLADPQPCWSFTHDFGQLHKSSRESRDASARSSTSSFSPTQLNDTTDASMDRSAHLVFTVPPCGRCSGLAGYFSCVLYKSASSPAVVLSTAPAQRTTDMYSWFPCTFTLDPTQRRELYEVEAAAATKSGAVAIHVWLARKTSEERRQVWYEWSVRYCDASEKEEPEEEEEVVVVHNRDGWASSMLL